MSDQSNSPSAHLANENFINRAVEHSMGAYDPKDEDLHPEFCRINPSPALNETQFFGFSVPEARIHALLYTWCHPNLNLISSGVVVVQGKRRMAPAFDILDYRAYLSAEELGGSLLNYKTSSGLEVEVIEPGKKFRTKYLDRERRNSFDVVHTGLHAPCVWSSNVHFEQVMKTEGEVVIRGKRYDVNGTHIRDRSWGEIREEVPRNIPPIAWITGAFDDGVCFHVTAFDSPELGPIWKDKFDLGSEDNLRFGWVIVDGEQAALKRVRKLTRYDEDLMPDEVEMEMVDERDRTFRVRGKTIAGFPFHVWPNCRWPICLARWDRDGSVGYGDVQDGQWTDFLLAVS